MRLSLEDLLVFDIETTGNPEMLKYAPVVDSDLMPVFDAPKSWKDPAKIQARIKERQGEWLEKQWAAKRKWIDRMAVDIDYAMVRCIGMALGSGEPKAFTVGQLKRDAGIDKDGVLTEAELLQWFWNKANLSAAVAGYNVLGFDIPVIMRRSWVLGVDPTRIFDLRPWGKDVLDIMRKLYHDGYGPGVKYRGLKDVIRVYGIETEWDAEGSGDKVDEMSIEEVNAYCVSDVARTRELIVRARGFYW